MRLLPLSEKNLNLLKRVEDAPWPGHHTTLNAMEKHGLIRYVSEGRYRLTEQGKQYVSE